MKGAWIFFGIFLLIALISLALGIRGYFSDQAFFRTAEHATATIVEYRPDRNPKVADFCPRFVFTTKDGKEVGYEGDECLSEPDPTRIGNTEEVYFDPKSPQSVYTKGWSGNEGSDLIFGAVGFTFFLLIGSTMPLATRLKSRTS